MYLIIILLIIFCKPNKPAIVDNLNKRERIIILFGGKREAERRRKRKLEKCGEGSLTLLFGFQKKHHVKIVERFLC